jgi:hypothetical protein
MNKTAIAAGLIVVAGIAVGTASLWRGESRRDAPDASPPPSRAAQPELRSATPAPAATNATGSAQVDVESSSHDIERVTGDVMRPAVAAQPSTSPEPPEADSEIDPSDGKSLAPALAAFRANFDKLLKDAGPDGAAIVAALPGAHAAIERLLNDPDPAVRDQAAALLKSLSGPKQ